MAILAPRQILRQKALKILDEDNRLKIDQATAARNLQIATDDIKESLARVGEARREGGPAIASYSEAARITWAPAATRKHNGKILGSARARLS